MGWVGGLGYGWGGGGGRIRSDIAPKSESDIDRVGDALSTPLPLTSSHFELLSFPQLRQEWFALISELQISDPRRISVFANVMILFYNSVNPHRQSHNCKESSKLFM